MFNSLKALAAIGALSICLSCAAAPVSTYPADSNGGASSFDYYVQTFASPTDQGFLSSLTVRVRASGPAVSLAIYEWTGANASNITNGSFAEVTGTPVFIQTIQTSPSPGIPPFDFFDVTVLPRIELLRSTTYGIVIEAGADSLAAWAFGTTAYAEGERLDRISAANHWSGHGGADFAFSASFVPEPDTLALAIAALFGVVTFSSRSKQH